MTLEQFVATKQLDGSAARKHSCLTLLPEVMTTTGQKIIAIHLVASWIVSDSKQASVLLRILFVIPLSTS